MTLTEKKEQLKSRIEDLTKLLENANTQLTYLNGLTPISASQLFTALGSITVFENQITQGFEIVINENTQYQIGSYNDLKVIFGTLVTVKTAYHLEAEQVEAIERYLRSLGKFDHIKIENE